MKRNQLLHLVTASKKGFLLGVVASLCFYAVIRIMFFEFSLSFSEEVINVVKIVLIGGLIIAGGFVAFLCLEILIRFISRFNFRVSEGSMIRIVAVIVLVIGVVFAYA